MSLVEYIGESPLDMTDPELDKFLDSVLDEGGCPHEYSSKDSDGDGWHRFHCIKCGAFVWATDKALKALERMAERDNERLSESSN